MALTFGASDPDQLESISALLQGAFDVSSNAPSVDPSYLNWKYYAARSDWPGSRSYILSEGSKIVAHAAIWPVRLHLPGGVLDGISFGDWVADHQHRGAGLLLLRKLMTLSSFILVTGGAPVTRAILPRAGFQPWAERQLFARVLRPLRQVFTRGQTLGWKEPARVARNTAWSLAPSAPHRTWTAEQTEVDDHLLEALPQHSGSIQSADYLRYMLRCPTVRYQFFTLKNGGKSCGFSLLGFAGGQARIADLRIASGEQSDWNSALAVMLTAAKEQPAACELVAFGSAEPLNQALRANGFQPRGKLPVVLFDPSGTIVQQPLPQLGMLEDDAGSLFEPTFPYRT